MDINDTNVLEHVLAYTIAAPVDIDITSEHENDTIDKENSSDISEESNLTLVIDRIMRDNFEVVHLRILKMIVPVMSLDRWICTHFMMILLKINVIQHLLPYVKVIQI